MLCLRTLVRFLQLIGRPWLRRAVLSETRGQAKRAEESILADERRLQSAGRKAKITVSPGVTVAGTDLRIPLECFLGHGIIAGATGSGKTRAALLLLRQLIEAGAKRTASGVGLLDLKGEFFGHATALCEQGHAGNVPTSFLDLSRRAAVPYDLLIPQHGENQAELIARRMETLGDLLGETDLSLRMSRMLRFLLTLLVESKLSFAALDHIVEVPDVAIRLATRSRDERLKRYFRGDFLKEQALTLPALRYRLDPLLSPESVRLSLSAGEQFDFCKAMDEGGIILINLAGAGNHAGRIFQSLILSDLRQAIFARRRTEVPFIWFCDEAQLLFKRPFDKANLSTILTLSRSFGVHLTLITQSLRSAISDNEFFQTLETNFGWMLLLRSGMGDAVIVRPGLRSTGRIRRGLSSGRPRYLTREQETHQLLTEIPNLPAREGYLWLRGSGSMALRITTHAVPDISVERRNYSTLGLAERIRVRLAGEDKFLQMDTDHAPLRGITDFLDQLEKEYPGE